MNKLEKINIFNFNLFQIQKLYFHAQKVIFKNQIVDIPCLQITIKKMHFYDEKFLYFNLKKLDLKIQNFELIHKFFDVKINYLGYINTLTYVISKLQ